MNTPTDLETLRRTFLDALVTGLGHLSAAGVLILLAAEMRLAGQSEPVEGQRATRSLPPV